MVPDAKEMLVGAIAIETREDCVTVRIVVPLIDLEVAAIVVFPVLFPVASPEPFVLATFGSEELQVAELVRSCVVPSV